MDIQELRFQKIQTTKEQCEHENLRYLGSQYCPAPWIYLNNFDDACRRDDLNFLGAILSYQNSADAHWNQS